ncbi:RHS repeat-associated core domain-containing protein [Neisseria subflava]|uniref:RHS repeat-associated core domain-containing protein n=1 Tax=Neisseria subflava TaxID=28449 RepID=UPI0024A81FF3|nr:RHS repeat-associated core domain-containing protein [Neisseria subflava]
MANETDFAFEGILPLVWSRSYYSDQDGTGWLGEGWSVPGCQRIIRDAAGLAYIDDQGRLFPLPEVDEDDEEPVLFESEQIWFSKNPDGHYVIASLDGSIALRFAPLVVAEDGSDEDATLFPLVAVEDTNGNHQRFVYHPLTDLPQYVIDGNGRVFSLNFGNVADEQSPKMRLLSVSLLEGLPAFGETARIGNLVRAANRHSITCFDYNGNGQIIGQHQWKVPTKEENAQNGLPETDWRDAQYDMLYLPVTESIRYHYDFNGNRTATVLLDGRQINYLYYGSGHLHQISLDDEVISDIERDRLHREIYRTQGKLASRYELDPLGRLKRQIAALNELTQTETAKNAVTSVYAVKRSYGYDRTGNLTHSTDQRTGTTKFEYDKLGRITQAGNELFAFDPAHNILSDNNSPTVPDNRLKTYNGSSYYYDHFGNLIHRELADGEVQNYFYDLLDQLVKAEIFKKDGTKETWAYTYDALGRRIGKGRLKNEEVSDGLEGETGFVWDGSHLLQEVQPDGRYTYLYTDPDSYEPLAQVRNWTNEDGESKQEIHYFHCDQIGIPREMTDDEGNLVWFGDYYGWGRLKEETRVTDSAYQPFRLQNQYADLETGLHYNFYRYYEPNLGRFINQDPIKLKGGNNLYQFAFNTQIWIDPKGLVAFAIPVIALELVALGKATLLLLGLGAAHEGGKAIGTMMAANGNQVDTGVANQVYEKNK